MSKIGILAGGGKLPKSIGDNLIKLGKTNDCARDDGDFIIILT